MVCYPCHILHQLHRISKYMLIDALMDETLASASVRVSHKKGIVNMAVGQRPGIAHGAAKPETTADRAQGSARMSVKRCRSSGQFVRP